MRHRPSYLAALVSLAMLAACMWTLPRAEAQVARTSPIVAIVSAQATLTDVSMALLRRIFLGEPTEHDGTRLVPINYPPSDPLRLAFDRAALGFTQAQAGRYWVDRRIRGQGLPPRAITGTTLVRSVVARLRGAISYITPDQLDDSVRALTVEGKSYKQEAYPLRFDVQ